MYRLYATRDLNLEKAGITKDIGLRTLRHTYATLSLQNDELQNVSRTLGHSSIRTTHDIYGHAIVGAGKHLDAS